MNMGGLAGKKILVTGGGGFLGSYVVAKLQACGVKEIQVPRSAQYNLCDPQEAWRLLEHAKPDIVIHLAAVYGGLEANRQSPGKIFYDNASMGLHLMEAARQTGVEKFVACGSYSSYPKHAPTPFREEDLWEGFPEDSIAGYGLAKKIVLAQGLFYRKQYGFNAIHVIPVNLYGPGDRFDPASANVAAALIRRCMETVRQGGTELTVWGSGKATREFLYVEDAAEAIVLAAAEYDGGEPVNIGTGIETPIRELAEMIADTVGFKGKLIWDTSKPDGHPRRYMDVRKAKDFFGFEAKVTLAEGIRRTVDWYRDQLKG